jgi:hypothetical protein
MKLKKSNGGSPHKVAIVFLAHDGILQPNVWKLWHEMCSYRDHLYYFVHCPEHLRPTDPLFNYIPAPIGPTGWCQTSIVYEHLRALKMSMYAISRTQHSTEEPIQCLYCMLSGSDIPLRSADFLFECEYKTRFKFTYDGYISHVSYNQWMILAQYEANLIVNYSLTDDYTATDKFITQVLKFLCGKRKLQDCPDELLIGNILYTILSEVDSSLLNNKQLFYNKYNGLITLLFKGLTTQLEYMGYTKTSPINWYTYNRIIAIENATQYISSDRQHPFYKRQTNDKIIKSDTEFDEDTPNNNFFYTHFLALIYYCNLYINSSKRELFSSVSTLVPESERAMFFRKVSKEMPFDEIAMFYRTLYSKNTHEISNTYHKLLEITPYLLIGDTTKWAHLTTSYDINYNLLCQLPKKPDYTDANPNTNTPEYDYHEDYEYRYNKHEMRHEAEQAYPYPIVSVENLEAFKKYNFNLPLNQYQRTGGTRDINSHVFIFDNKKYIISNNKNKYTVTENGKYISTQSVKKLLTKILKATYQ